MNADMRRKLKTLIEQNAEGTTKPSGNALAAGLKDALEAEVEAREILIDLLDFLFDGRHWARFEAADLEALDDTEQAAIKLVRS